MARTKTHPVAIVVFVNAEGVDARDAVNVAERAVAEALHGASGGTGQLHLSAGRAAGRTERQVGVGQVVELGLAVRAGHIGLATSPEAYTP